MKDLLILKNCCTRFQAAEAARERKKRLVHNSEILKFEKSLEMAQKQLRETNNGFVNGSNNKQDIDMAVKANIPLTETTKRLSQQDRTNEENGAPVGRDSPTKPRYLLYDHPISVRNISVGGSRNFCKGHQSPHTASYRKMLMHLYSLITNLMQ